MTRPKIVRADTLDLQDQHSPSAKDHSKQPTHATSLGGGRQPSHQEQAVRRAEQNLKADMLRGPDAVSIQLQDDEQTDAIDIYDEQEGVDDAISRDHEIRGRHSLEERDLANGQGDDDDILDDDLMDRISSSPSIDDDDIDFDLVYSLHTFEATVEGQANAAKGDTMVLLDDSNSYWWLVRVVKDGSIGYLPAEYIETPTERLARLNKHRNIDLSATMLGDNSERSRNPLKKAMRRRNAKTVTFTAPTYIEASDVEYSTDEEPVDGDFFNINDETGTADDSNLQDGQNEIVVEPLRPKPLQQKGTEEAETSEWTEEGDISSPTKPRTSEELQETQADLKVSRSRNGTVRNTDSFFKDDTVETKKISLTPNLLRDELSSNSLNDPREGRGSFETAEKGYGSSEKGKDEKRKKDKKSGMLSGLFKRKDKKNKVVDDEIDEVERTISPQPKSSPKSSMESMSREPRPSKSSGSQVQPSNKLQGQPLSDTLPAKGDPRYNLPHLSTSASFDSSASVGRSKADLSIRQVVSQESTSHFSNSSHSQASDSMSRPSENIESITKAASTTPDSAESSISPVDMPPKEPVSPAEQPVSSSTQKFIPTENLESEDTNIESPVIVSPLEAPASRSVPGLVRDNSSLEDERSVSPISPSSPKGDTYAHNEVAEAAHAHAEQASVEALTWNDTSLRAFFEDENEIRHLFIIVHDKSNVPPAGPDHPISGSLFKEESERLNEMSHKLDEMLVEWIGRRIQRSLNI